MAKAKRQQENAEQAEPENAEAAPVERAEQDVPENAEAPPVERAVEPAPERRAGYVPRSVRMVGANDYSRARPRQKPVRVIRSWPGVKNAQLVVLHPAHQKRLLKGGFVEEVR